MCRSAYTYEYLWAPSIWKPSTQKRPQDPPKRPDFRPGAGKWPQRSPDRPPGAIFGQEPESRPKEPQNSVLDDDGDDDDNDDGDENDEDDAYTYTHIHTHTCTYTYTYTYK